MADKQTLQQTAERLTSKFMPTWDMDDICDAKAVIRQLQRMLERARAFKATHDGYEFHHEPELLQILNPNQELQG